MVRPPGDQRSARLSGRRRRIAVLGGAGPRVLRHGLRGGGPHERRGRQSVHRRPVAQASDLRPPAAGRGARGARQAARPRPAGHGDAARGRFSKSEAMSTSSTAARPCSPTSTNSRPCETASRRRWPGWATTWRLPTGWSAPALVRIFALPAVRSIADGQGGARLAAGLARALRVAQGDNVRHVAF